MSNPVTRGRHDGGFSLIEILVAFTIMAIALTVVLQAISAGLRNTTVVQDYNRALEIAERHVTLARSRVPEQTGERSGVTDGRYRWQERTERVNWSGRGGQTTERYQLHRITVRVAWGEGGNARDVRLVTMQSTYGGQP